MEKAPSYALFNPETFSSTSADAAKVQEILTAANQAAARPPEARERLHVEGTLPHQGIYDESRKSLRDMEAVLDLAVAWRLTAKPVYLKACQTYYGAWLAVYHPSFNPIDETRFDSFIFGYDLVGARLPVEIQARMKTFLRTMAEGYLEGRGITMEGTRTNNWQSHRVKLAVLAAFELGDPKLIARAKAAFKKQLGANLNGDGSVLDFKERDALHYTVYDLEPLVTVALAAKVHGQDWFGLTNAKGASLETALEWLAPFAEGKETHLEYVRSTVPFDAQRRAAGVKGFSGAWEPGTSGLLYGFASRLNGRWSSLARKLGGTPAWMDCLLPLGGDAK